MAVLTPAYGRDYHSAAKVLEAYHQGADFIYHNPASRWDGAYCSKADMKGQTVALRYARLTKAVLVES